MVVLTIVFSFDIALHPTAPAPAPPPGLAMVVVRANTTLPVQDLVPIRGTFHRRRDRDRGYHDAVTTRTRPVPVPINI